jgi:hypothetical protein
MKKMVISLGLAVVLGFGITYVYGQGPGYRSIGGAHWRWSSSAAERGSRFQGSDQRPNNGMAQFGSGRGKGTGFLDGSRMGYGFCFKN